MHSLIFFGYKIKWPQFFYFLFLSLFLEFKTRHMTLLSLRLFQKKKFFNCSDDQQTSLFKEETSSCWYCSKACQGDLCFQCETKLEKTHLKEMKQLNECHKRLSLIIQRHNTKLEHSNKSCSIYATCSLFSRKHVANH